MDNIGDIIEQEPIGETLIVETNAQDDSSSGGSHGVVTRNGGTVVMIGTVPNHMRGRHIVEYRELDEQRARLIAHRGLELLKGGPGAGNEMISTNHAAADDVDEVEISLEAAAHSNSKQQEMLSVIVQPQDDSRDSQLLSPGKLTPSSEIIDTDFRNLNEPTYQTLTSVNGRMSPPGFSPSSSYATLTPLQPLPPISTMSDKFAYAGHGNNSNFQNNNMNINLGLNVNSPYHFDKLPSIGISPPHSYSSPTNLGGMGIVSQQPSPLSPQSSFSQNEIHQSPTQKSMSPNGYESPYSSHIRGVGQGHGGGGDTSPQLSPQEGSLHSPGGTTNFCSNSLGALNGIPSIAAHSTISSGNSPGLVQISHIHRVGGGASNVNDQISPPSPSPPLLAIHQQQQQQHQQTSNNNVQSTNNLLQIQQQQQNSGAISTSSGGGNGGKNSIGANNINLNSSSTSLSLTSDVEEINTKELAQRISAELKRYSIPQAIFAQRVLCRSQGTLSDLLRNPKPWSKLKSGRETFRRMFKWLQEPEYQRMSALRLAGTFILFKSF